MHYRVMGFYLFYFFILFLFIFLIGKNWIDLERNTLHRQRVEHLRR